MHTIHYPPLLRRNQSISLFEQSSELLSTHVKWAFRLWRDNNYFPVEAYGRISNPVYLEKWESGMGAIPLPDEYVSIANKGWQTI